MHENQRWWLALAGLLVVACEDPDAPTQGACDDAHEACDDPSIEGDEVAEEDSPEADDGGPDTSAPGTLAADSRPSAGGAFLEVWFPDGDIPFSVDGNFSAGDAADVRDVMAYFEDHMPLETSEVATTSAMRHLFFNEVNSAPYCGLAFEYWVQNKNNPQLDIKDSCNTEVTAFHEMFHALGFPHEFQRPDRDDFVDVCFNVDPFNYAKTGSIYWPDDHAMLSPFDFESITNGSGGYTGAGNCVTSDVGSFSDPTWRGWDQPLSRHDINSVYRIYGKALDEADPNDNYGNALAAGDFDDDGIEDLVVVSRERLNASWARIFLNFYRGVELDPSEGGAGTKYMPWFREELDLAGSNSVRLSAAAGDFDGDGIVEIAVGDRSWGAGRGRVFVVTVNDDSGSEAPWGTKGVLGVDVIDPQDVGLQYGRPHGFGASLTTGHLTNLQRDDLVIGAPDADEVVNLGGTGYGPGESCPVDPNPFEESPFNPPQTCPTTQPGQFPTTLQTVVEDGGAVVHLRGASTFGAEITWNPDFVPPFTGTSNDFGHALTTLPFYCDMDPAASNDTYATFVVGAPGFDADAGAVYVYGCAREALTDWPAASTLRRRVTHAQSDARYGSAVAGFRTNESIFGLGATQHMVAIGAPGWENTSGVSKGRVYLDEFDAAGNKTFVASFSPGSGGDGDKFGQSIAVFQGGDLGIVDRRFVHLAIGAPRATASGVRSGRVFMWQPLEQGGTSNTALVWSPTSPAAGMRFGKSVVAVRADSPSGGFAIGAPKATVSGVSSAGRVTVRLDEDAESEDWDSDKQELDIEMGPDYPPLN